MKFNYLLIAAVSVLVLFASCSSNDGPPTENPVRNIQMPPADPPILAGDAFTIGGQGFRSDCEIWIRLAGASGTGYIQLTVEQVTDTYVDVRTPRSIEGEYQVILRQGGGEYILGNIFVVRYFTESLHFVIGDLSEQYIYHLQNNNLVRGDRLSTTLSFESGSVSVGNKGYFRTYGANPHWGAQAIRYYDFATNSESLVREGWDYEGGVALGEVGDKLYGVKFTPGEGFAVVQMSNTGQEAPVATFAVPWNVFQCVQRVFYYDINTNTILLTGEKDNEDIPTGVSLNLTTNAINTRAFEGIHPQDITLAAGGGNVYCVRYKSSDNDDQMIYTIDPATMADKDLIYDVSPLTYISHYVGPVYLPVSRKILFCGDEGVRQFDVRTNTFGDFVLLPQNNDILAIFVEAE